MDRLFGDASHSNYDGPGTSGEKVCKTDYKINPERVGELSVELDNISFFKDNEYAGTVMKGYSLPGMWLEPKVV